MGEGVPPVPAKLASRIRRGEFVDMLPEFWSTSKQEGAKEAKSRQTRKVDDIFTWLQSFASYVVVRGAAAPELLPVDYRAGEPGFHWPGMGPL